MPTSPDKSVFHLVLDKDTKQKFDRLYTKMLFRPFINKCLELSVQDKDFFDEVFFGTRSNL